MKHQNVTRRLRHLSSEAERMALAEFRGGREEESEKLSIRTEKIEREDRELRFSFSEVVA